MFLFCWAAFLFISLLASVFPVSLPLIFLFLRHRLIHARMSNWGRTHFLAFMEWADDGGSRPAACSNVPVQSSSCALRAFYRTFVVGKDTYYAPLVIIMMLICVFFLQVLSALDILQPPSIDQFHEMYPLSNIHQLFFS